MKKEQVARKFEEGQVLYVNLGRKFNYSIVKAIYICEDENDKNSIVVKPFDIFLGKDKFVYLTMNIRMVVNNYQAYKDLLELGASMGK